MTAKREVAMRRASGFDAGMDELLKATRYIVTDIGTHNEYPERDHQVFLDMYLRLSNGTHWLLLP